MGQGLYTKVAQGVAHTLGVPVDSIKVRPNQTIITPNNVVSGGSVASETSMQAAIEATKYTFAPPPRDMPCIYFTYCAAVVETEVDILTGESQIRRVDLMADYGESLNPTIDIGQTEGAFVMGLGCFLSEDIIFDGQTGKILNDGTWEYKPPTTKDIPVDWRIHLLPDTPNPSGIHSSKAVGEPPISLSVGALLANKLAVEAARKDLCEANDFISPVAPYSVERIQQSVGLTVEKLIL
ncbi:hypothetical protein Btru_071424 [Bulinus truncatus]|nr:hypothetical protein Btru_071424 [Bulinus truncatus]